jgi:hypothetical protein
MYRNKKAVLEKPYMIPIPDDPLNAIELELWCDYYRDYIAPNEECKEPMSTLLYPIVNILDRIEISGSDMYGLDGELKGELTIEFYWRAKFRDILPYNSNGIVLVVKNTCGGDFTYQINGPSVKYLGGGDKHDPKYDHMSRESNLFDLKSYFQEDSKYSGLSLENETCIYSFHVYPSDEMKDRKLMLCFFWIFLVCFYLANQNHSLQRLPYKQCDSICAVGRCIHFLAIFNVCDL